MNNQLFFLKRGVTNYCRERKQKSRNSDTTQTAISDRIGGPRERIFIFFRKPFTSTTTSLNWISVNLVKYSGQRKQSINDVRWSAVEYFSSGRHGLEERKFGVKV